MRKVLIESFAYGIVDEIEVDDNISDEEIEILANEVYLEFIQSNDYNGFTIKEE